MRDEECMDEVVLNYFDVSYLIIDDIISAIKRNEI